MELRQIRYFIAVAGFASDRALLWVRRRLLAGQTLSKEEFSA